MKVIMRKGFERRHSRGADALFTDFEASQAVCALKTRAVFSR